MENFARDCYRLNIEASRRFYDRAIVTPCERSVRRKPRDDVFENERNDLLSAISQFVSASTLPIAKSNRDTTIVTKFLARREQVRPSPTKVLFVYRLPSRVFTHPEQRVRESDVLRYRRNYCPRRQYSTATRLARQNLRNSVSRLSQRQPYFAESSVSPEESGELCGVQSCFVYAASPAEAAAPSCN